MWDAGSRPPLPCEGGKGVIIASTFNLHSTDVRGCQWRTVWPTYIDTYQPDMLYLADPDKKTEPQQPETSLPLLSLPSLPSLRSLPHPWGKEGIWDIVTRFFSPPQFCRWFVHTGFREGGRGLLISDPMDPLMEALTSREKKCRKKREWVFEWSLLYSLLELKSPGKMSHCVWTHTRVWRVPRYNGITGTERLTQVCMLWDHRGVAMDSIQGKQPKKKGGGGIQGGPTCLRSAANLW